MHRHLHFFPKPQAPKSLLEKTATTLKYDAGTSAESPPPIPSFGDSPPQGGAGVRSVLHGDYSRRWGTCKPSMQGFLCTCWAMGQSRLPRLSHGLTLEITQFGRVKHCNCNCTPMGMSAEQDTDTACFFSFVIQFRFLLAAWNIQILNLI